MKFKRFISVFCLFAMLIALFSVFTSCGEKPEYMELNGTKYKLTFKDDFDGTELDTKKWQLCPEWQRQDVGGYWNNEMVSLDGGYLVLTADVRDGVPVSGAIRTKDIFEQNKGYFEISAKLQSASGYWFAFWLMDPNMKNENANDARDGAEIDIMESFNVASGGINHAIHWDGYEEYHKSDTHSIYNKDLYSGFHTYALEWTDECYIFYIDGVETYRTSDPGMCENELYIKVTTEFGSWAGSIRDNQLPDNAYVDYVKAYAPVG